MDGQQRPKKNGKNRRRRFKNPREKNKAKNIDQKSSKKCSDDKFVEILCDFLPKKDFKGLSDAIFGSQRFIAILNSYISDESLLSIIKIVAKLFESDADINKNYIVKVIMTQRFTKRVNSFLSTLVTDDKINPRYFTWANNMLIYIALIMETALNLQPMSTFGLVKTLLKNLKVVLPILKSEKPVKISGSTEENFQNIEQSIEKIEKQFENPDVVIDSDSPESNELKTLENYRKINIVPEKAELLINERPTLRKNIVDRPYPSIADYLDIHFRLLREDFVNPIREDISSYLKGSNKRLFNIKIHNDVKFLERSILRDLRAFKIQFQIPKFLEKSIAKGQKQKRFLNGSLLIFSNDHFETIIYGKIVETKYLKYGRVVVQILTENETPDFQHNYIMIECVLFFEPYYQVLSVFQELTDEHLPMEDYIIKINADTREPDYMKDVKYVHEIEGLNPSQAEAHKAAMTRDYVIIQGPPGTGKTFLGMKIVEEILTFRENWQHKGPILIICFTNHALDQFLDGLRKVTEKIGRLGGKCNGFMELSKKFGPESFILNLLENELKYDKSYYESHGVRCKKDGDCKKDCDYRRYTGFLQMLKSCKIDEYRGTFKNAIKKITPEIQNWLRAKDRMGHSYGVVKGAERDIREVQNSILDLEIFKHDSILNTSFLFAGQYSRLQYQFNNFELACWLLCDDGTIQSDWETVATVGLNNQHNPNERGTINRLLNDCLGGIRMNKKYVFLTPWHLNTLRQDIEDCIKNNPNSKFVFTDYLNFIRNKIDYLKMCLGKDFGPPEVNFNNYRDPFLIPCKNRWQIYHQWIENKKNIMRQNLKQRMDDYQEHFAAHEIIREADNVSLLKQMDIVGMTTTCAAKMRSTLEALKCPIVVVEEAAEVLESHIVSALTESCQHLILLGDHKQLRPSTADYTIEKKYKLGISLFERMVINEVQCYTLNVQHRMRPEISRLLRPTFYEDLQDSESVQRYPDVSGVGKNIFFIDHQEPEEPYGDSSKMNRHEAQFLIQLAVYFLKNNYHPEEITILAAYLGQVHFLNEVKAKCSHPLIKDVHITPVDNFQGEENRIILLSLVRSNLDNNIGFLSVDNRVCVALSRAREGFFVMGNMSILCSASQVWKPIKSCLESQKAIGKYLPLQCINHKQCVTFASKPSDFALVPEGGCDRLCNADLKCGHKCTSQCHGYDLDHSAYKCDEPCTRSLCGKPDHKCLKSCFEDCGPCLKLVEKRCPCDHTNLIECSVDPNERPCTFKIRMTCLLCQHINTISCHKRANFKCIKKTEHLLPCGHKQFIPCDKEVNSFKCQQLLTIKLRCGHSLTVKCHEQTEDHPCHMKCKALLDCGHLCPRTCHTNDDPKHVKYECKQRCLRSKPGCTFPEQHPKCKLPCFQPCEKCTKKIITFNADRCSHLNKIECHLTKSVVECEKVCNKELPCGHYCRRRCYECTCRKLCQDCKQKCGKTLACGHPCIKLCKESDCACRKVMFRGCRHTQMKKCTEERNPNEKCPSCQLKMVTNKLSKL